MGQAGSSRNFITRKKQNRSPPVNVSAHSVLIHELGLEHFLMHIPIKIYLKQRGSASKFLGPDTVRIISK